MVRLLAIDHTRAILEQTTATDIKKVVGNTNAKFPRQQQDIETFPTELSEKQYRQARQLYLQKIQTQKKRQTKRGYEQLIGDILEPALNSYKGMITMAAISKLIDNDKNMKHWISRALNLGLIRNATDDEVVELAKRQLILQSHYTPNLEGGYQHGKDLYNEIPALMPPKPLPKYYKTKEPPMHLVRKHIKQHLSRVFVLTDKGRRVGGILHEMKEMLS